MTTTTRTKKMMSNSISVCWIILSSSLSFLSCLWCVDCFSTSSSSLSLLLQQQQQQQQGRRGLPVVLSSSMRRTTTSTGRRSSSSVASKPLPEYSVVDEEEVAEILLKKKKNDEKTTTATTVIDGGDHHDGMQENDQSNHDDYDDDDLNSMMDLDLRQQRFHHHDRRRQQEEEDQHAIGYSPYSSPSRSRREEVLISPDYQYCALSPGTVVKIQMGNDIINQARKVWKKRRRNASPLLVPCSVLSIDHYTTIRRNILYLLERYGSSCPTIIDAPIVNKESDNAMQHQSSSSTSTSTTTSIMVPGIRISLDELCMYHEIHMKSSIHEHATVLGYDTTYDLIVSLFSEQIQQMYNIKLITKEIKKQRNQDHEKEQEEELINSTSLEQQQQPPPPPPEQPLLLRNLWLESPISRSKATRRADSTALLQFDNINKNNENEKEKDGAAAAAVTTDASGDAAHGSDDLDGDDDDEEERLYHTGIVGIPSQKHGNDDNGERPMNIQPLSAALRVSKGELDSGSINDDSYQTAVVYDYDPMGDAGSPLLTLSLTASRQKMMNDRFSSGTDTNSIGADELSSLTIQALQQQQQREEQQQHSSQQQYQYRHKNHYHHYAPRRHARETIINPKYMLHDIDLGDGPFVGKVIHLMKDGALIDCSIGRPILNNNGPSPTHQEHQQQQIVDNDKDDDDDDIHNPPSIPSNMAMKVYGFLRFRDTMADDIVERTLKNTTITQQQQRRKYRTKLWINENNKGKQSSNNNKNSPSSTTKTSSSGHQHQHPQHHRFRTKLLNVGDEVNVYVKSLSEPQQQQASSSKRWWLSSPVNHMMTIQYSMDPSIHNMKPKDIKQSSTISKRLERLSKQIGGLGTIKTITGRECDGIIHATSKKRILLMQQKQQQNQNRSSRSNSKDGIADDNDNDDDAVLYVKPCSSDSYAMDYQGNYDKRDERMAMNEIMNNLPVGVATIDTTYNSGKRMDDDEDDLLSLDELCKGDKVRIRIDGIDEHRGQLALKVLKKLTP